MCTQRGDAVLSSGVHEANEAQAIELAVQLNAYAQQRVRQTNGNRAKRLLPVSALYWDPNRPDADGKRYEFCHCHVHGKSNVQARRISSTNRSTLASASVDAMEPLEIN
eukprot:1142245-Pelagomonas_calceolata.AAC.2